MDGSQRSDLFEVISKFKKMRSWVPPVAGLSHGEFFMMHMIDNYKRQKDGQDTPGIKISTLCAHTHMSMPGASQMLNSLESKGMIERIMAKDDRRVIYVDFTEKGQALLTEAMQKFLGTMDQVLEEFGERDSKELIVLLNRLSDIMERLKSAK
jgi:DNA-binding MarR family transcriptional regulator